MTPIAGGYLLLRPISEALGADWQVREVLGSPVQFQWTEIGQIRGDVDFKWNILGSIVGGQRMLQWHTRALSDDALEVPWSIRTGVPLSDVDLEWRIREMMNSQASARWRSLMRASSDIANDWSIQYIVLDSTQLDWQQRVARANEIALVWDVMGALIAALTSLEWGVRGRTTSDLELEFAIRTILDNGLDSRWATRTMLGGDKGFSWRVVGVSGNEVSIQWRVEGMPGAPFMGTQIIYLQHVIPVIRLYRTETETSLIVLDDGTP